MTKVTFKNRKFHGNNNIERYCENCGNYDEGWEIGQGNDTKWIKNEKSIHCKKCKYLAPSQYTPIPSPPEPEITMSDQDIIDEHHRLKYGEY